MIPLIICIRNTTDWSSITKNDLKYPEGVWQNPENDMRNAMFIWDKITAESDYVGFRRKMKDIALQNWSNVIGSSVVDATSTDIPELVKALSEKYENYFLMPTDDDDWIHPKIALFLNECDFSRSLCVRWRGTRYDTTGVRSKIIDTTNDLFAESNSFVFTKSGLNRLSENDLVQAIRAHTYLYKCFFDPEFLDRRLSIYNKHCGSIGYLMNDNPNRAFKQDIPVLKEDTIWAKPYMKSLARSINRLRINSAILM